MSRTAYKFSAAIVSLLLAGLLAACGSSHREANANPESVAFVAEATCRVCHSTSIDPVLARTILPDFLASPHNSDEAGCQGCHGGGAEHNGVGPIPFPNPIDRCKVCHNATLVNGLITANIPVTFDNNTTVRAQHLSTFLPSAGGAGNCGTCHYPHNPTNAPFIGGSCVACHAFAQDETDKGNYVNDNNGVRAIVAEFSKWSHHVTGVTVNNAHCAACHLEGKVSNGQIVVDTTKHMADAQVHLRNADNDADFVWDPAAPNHSNMDNFCMSCHDANGATSPESAQIQAIINSKNLVATGKTASATNPFGDTISNRYDKMQRPAVVDASSQFNLGNNSHHAVKGPRYTGRTRLAGDRQIASPATFATNSTALLKGRRSTMYDAQVVLQPSLATTSVLNQLYVPLENAAGEVAPRTGSSTLGDDSTLHCGDCHTVGQWRPQVATNALGVLNTVAIGAHGSNNEYLLRNSIGSDQRHRQNAYTSAGGFITFTDPTAPFLVCYNCHTYAQYGSVYNATGVAGPHAGEYDQAGRCDGVGNTLPFNGYTTGTATDGTQFVSRFDGPISRYGATPAFAPGFPLVGTPPVGEQNPDFGDIFGIQCLNCHNSGLGNGYGGIHGSAKNTNTTTKTTNPAVTGGAYIDGMGNTVKVERFLPGLGDAMHVPGTLGGITGGASAFFNGSTASGGSYTTGGISNDTNWEQKHWQQTAATSFGATGQGPVTGTLTSAGAGCYTLSESATAATANLVGPSVTGAGGPATEGFGTWGGCDDHGARQGGGDHGFIKRIVRPVTY
jgi:hypothetical protein